MTLPPAATASHIVRRSRVLPQQPPSHEHAVPLSLLDATTANFGLTSAIWLFGPPNVSSDSLNLTAHLRTSLSATLSAYPQWCGYLKSILTLNQDDLPPESTSFPAHARRYGRVYVQYGTGFDPGVEFVEASSSATVDDLYKSTSEFRRPIWNRRGNGTDLADFVPSTDIVRALEPNEANAEGLCKPIMAVQVTELACGGFVLAAKIAHPLADISSLVRFVKDWGSVSRAMFTGSPLPVFDRVFEPARLDACAAGDINAKDSGTTVIEDALGLPMHRYDWWAPPVKAPSPFPEEVPLAKGGKAMPWAEWDRGAPVAQYTVHFSREQIDYLYRFATKEVSAESSAVKLSKHDALLAHIWSCVVRARNLQDDRGPVHCDLVLGTRPAFRLGEDFLGSPTLMMNIEMAASDVAANNLELIARRIRETVSRVNNSERLAAHLHSIAYESSPQRIWQGFLGQRHIMVTTWARAGLYDVDLGLGSRIRYADGVVPCLDGCILIVDGPPTEQGEKESTIAREWTDNGVDVTLPLRSEDMERLLRDPLLLPKVQ